MNANAKKMTECYCDMIEPATPNSLARYYECVPCRLQRGEPVTAAEIEADEHDVEQEDDGDCHCYDCKESRRG